MFNIEDYDYDLPKELIAQEPASVRDRSRLLFVERHRESLSDHHFLDLPGLLRHGDLLVVNNTRVVPARLLGHKSTGGKVEVLILDYAGGLQRLSAEGAFTSACLIKASKQARKGTRLIFDEMLVGMDEGVTIAAKAWEGCANATVQGNRLSAVCAESAE